MIDAAFATIRSTALILVGLGVIALVMRRRSAAARHHALRALLLAASVAPVVTTAAYFIPKIATAPVSAQAVQAAPVWFPVTAMPAQSYRLRTPPMSEIHSDMLTTIAGIGVSFALWLGVYFLLSHPARRAWSRLQRIERGAVELEPFDGIPVLRATDPELRVPVAYGRPGKVLLPADSKDWPEARLQAARFHEAAHVRRADPLWIAYARNVAAVYWFSPGFFLLARALRDTAEEAADDAALAAGIRPSDYARELLAVAHRANRLDAAAVAMVGRAGLRGRVAAILSPRRDRRQATVALGIGAGIAFGLVTFVVADVGLRMDRLTMPLPAGAVVSDTGKVTLADGTEVFLSSVEEVTMDRVVAWNKYGSDAEFLQGQRPVSLSPEGKGHTLFNVSVYASEPSAGVAVRLPAALGGAGISTSSRADSVHATATASVEQVDHPALSTDVAVGIATGPWQTSSVTPLAHADRRIEPNRPGSVEFVLPTRADGFQWNAIAYSGNATLPGATTNARLEGGGRAAIAVDLQPGQRIDRVVLSTRPYRWAVFRDVSLHPGREALAKARRPKLRRSVVGDGRVVSYEIVGTEARP